MKKIKIILDIIMTIIMLLLMKTNITGLKLHEILGLVLFVMFIIHKILNFKWIKAVGKNIFNNNMKIKSKAMFILELIMFVFVTLNVISGILISRFVLSNISINNIENATILHKFFAWWSLILISIHIGLHWENVVRYFENKFKILKDNKIIKVIFTLFYIIILIIGIWSLSKNSRYLKLMPTTHNVQGISTEIQQYKERKFKNQKNNQENLNNNIADNIIEDANSSKLENESNIQSLEEYLNQFNCVGCRRNCSLLNPNCEIGENLKEEKIKEYYSMYNKNESNTNNELNINNLYNISKKNNRNNKNIIDSISIMCMFIGGTYYITKKLNF